MRHCAIDKCLVTRTQQRPRRTVRHREGTTVNIRRWRKQICQCTLMHPGKAAMLLFVSNSHDAMLDRDPFSDTPQRRHFDLIDAIPPRVPLRQPRFIQAISELQVVKLTACEPAHLEERALDFAQHLSRQNAREVGTQHAIVFVLIAEFWRRLLEWHDQRFTQSRQISKMERSLVLGVLYLVLCGLTTDLGKVKRSKH